MAIILNEVHQWVRSNQGIAMYDVIERNAAKANGGGARLFAITNAHNPSEESVGRMIRDAYEMRASGVAIAGGVDSASDAPIVVTESLRKALLALNRARSLPEKLAAHENALGLQMFAHRDGTDGFYVCRMRRVKA